MSQENVEIVRRAYEHRQAHGDFLAESLATDYVWDMSHFQGWPEQQTYEGIDEARRFIREWTTAFDDWEIEIVAIHDAGDDRVVGVVRAAWPRQVHWLARGHAIRTGLHLSRRQAGADGNVCRPGRGSQSRGAGGVGTATAPSVARC